MFVATGPVRTAGRKLAYGEAIPNIEDWPPYIVKNHLRQGLIREVDGEEAEQMQALARRKHLSAQAAQLTRDASKAKAARQAVSAKMQRLTDELSAAEAEYETAEAAEGAAVDALAEFRKEHGAEPFESRRTKPPIVDPEHKQAEAKLDLPDPKRILDSVRSALAGLARAKIPGAVREWYGVSMYDAAVLNAYGLKTKQNADGEVLMSSKRHTVLNAAIDLAYKAQLAKLRPDIIEAEAAAAEAEATRADRDLEAVRAARAARSDDGAGEIGVEEPDEDGEE